MQHNAELEEEVANLSEQIRCLRFENQNINMVEWVAQTGHKAKRNQQQ